MHFLTILLDLIYPIKCPFCQTIQNTPGICRSCEATLPWTGEASLRQIPNNLRCAAPLWYEGPVREAIHRYKFQSAAGAAIPLGRCIAQTAAERFSGEFDTITWVPLSPKRLRRRGYDQARLLAEEACRAWGVKPQRLLRKVRHTLPQSSLSSAAARTQNVRRAYVPAGPIAGRRVLLIDDVCTTGSTLTACSGVLLAAGASSVVCAAAAFAGKPEKSREKGKE